MIVELLALFRERLVEGVVGRLDTARLIGIEVIDVAVLEGTPGKCELLRAVVKNECAPNEGAFVKSAEVHSAAEVERLRIKRLFPNDSLVDCACHFVICYCLTALAI